MKYTFGNFCFEHLRNNEFIINNRDIVKINYKSERIPYMEYMGNPSTFIPNEIVKKFEAKIKEDFPAGFPNSIS